MTAAAHPAGGGYSSSTPALEPANAPQFTRGLLGYSRREVDEYVEFQRQRLAAMRQRAQRAEDALAHRGRIDHPVAVAPGRAPVALVARRGALAVAAVPATSSASVELPPSATPRPLRAHRPEHLRPRGRLAQIVRYGGVSLISIVLTEMLVFGFYGVGHLGSAVVCTTAASLLAAVPTYALNRRWVWGVVGRSRLWQEVVPFWTTVAVGIAASAAAVDIVTRIARAELHSHLLRSGVIVAASLGAYGVLWAARFLVLDRFVFGLREARA